MFNKVFFTATWLNAGANNRKYFRKYICAKATVRKNTM